MTDPARQIANLQRKMRRLEKMADTVEPGVVHALIDLDVLNLLYQGDQEKVQRDVSRELGARAIWNPELHDMRADVIVAFTDPLSGRPGKLLIMGYKGRVPLQNASFFSGFSRETCAALELDKRGFDFTIHTIDQFVLAHELAHWMTADFAARRAKSDPAEVMLDNHRGEALADAFATLRLLQMSQDNLPLLEMLANCRNIKPLAAQLQRMEGGDPFSQEHHEGWICHIGSPCIRAAIDWAKSQKELKALSFPDLLKAARDISKAHSYSAAQLQDMTADLKSAVERVHAAEPVAEIDRLPYAVQIGALDLQKPWVKEMIQSWEGITGRQIAPTTGTFTGKLAEPSAAHTDSIARRDPTKTRGNGFPRR